MNNSLFWHRFSSTWTVNVKSRLILLIRVVWKPIQLTVNKFMSNINEINESFELIWEYETDSKANSNNLHSFMGNLIFPWFVYCPYALFPELSKMYQCCIMCPIYTKNDYGKEMEMALNVASNFGLFSKTCYSWNIALKYVILRSNQSPFQNHLVLGEHLDINLLVIFLRNSAEVPSKHLKSCKITHSNIATFLFFFFLYCHRYISRVRYQRRTRRIYTIGYVCYSGYRQSGTECTIRKTAYLRNHQ